MSKIKGSKVLITGGAMGLGRLFAQACIEEGASNIVIWDINQSALSETETQLNALGDCKVIGFQVDVSDVKQINEVGRKVLNEIGVIDIVFNNAGIVIGSKLFSEHTEKDIDSTLSINTAALMHVCRVFVPGMINQSAGHVVNIASAAGLVPNPKMSVYAASKWAVIGWSESLRIELEQTKSGVNVTTVCPFYINTGMFDGVNSVLFTPMLDQHKVVSTVIKAVKNNRILIRMPFMIKTLPLLRGLMPTRLFDFVAGNIFGVYKTMDTFKGRK